MRRFIVTLLALSIVSVMGHVAAAQTVKLGTLAPEGSSWHQIIRDLAEDWRTLSGGALDVRIYPGGTAGDEPDMVRKMKIGQLHAAALTGAGPGADRPGDPGPAAADDAALERRA